MMTREFLFLGVGFLVTALCSCSGRAESPSSEIADEVSYTNDIRPIVNNFCLTCHSGDTPQGDFVLTGYQDVLKHTKNGELLHRINDANDPMPQNGLMPAYLRRMFKVWADQGYVNQGDAKPTTERKQMQEFTPPKIVPVDINTRGFEMLEFLRGHWVGSMNLMGQDFEWWAFDFRPIAASHIQ